MEALRERERELMVLLEAIDGVLTNEDWQVLAEVLWKKRIELLDRQILQATEKNPIDLPEIIELKGRKAEAKRYIDLKELAKPLIKELEAIKRKLQ